VSRRLLILLACLALALAACDSGPEPLHEVGAAAERTAEAGSLRYSLISVTDPGTPDEVTMLGEGTIHAEQERSWRRWRPEGGVFPGEDPDAACPDDRNEVLETPTTWYVFSPVWTECEPVWMVVNMPVLREEGVTLTPADVLGLGTVPTMDPLDALSYLQRTPGEVTELGAEELDGEAMTRYRLVTEVPDALPIDVWVDDRGHLRRIHYDGELVSTLELFDIGSAPRVPIQPDGETVPGDWLIRLHSDAAA
jgi:hypothetical protein